MRSYPQSLLQHLMRLNPCAVMPHCRYASNSCRTYPGSPTRCVSKMRVVASLTSPKSIASYLAGIGEKTEPPPITPARSPPQLCFDDVIGDEVLQNEESDYAA